MYSSSLFIVGRGLSDRGSRGLSFRSKRFADNKLKRPKTVSFLTLSSDTMPNHVLPSHNIIRLLFSAVSTAVLFEVPPETAE